MSRPKSFSSSLSNLGKILKDASPNLTKDYTLGDKLGDGAFAEVKKGINKKTHEPVAIKMIRKKELVSEEEKQNVIREIDIQKQLNHPNIVQLKAVYETREHICLVLDLVTGGELFERISKLGSYTERDASLVMLALFKTVKYIHDHNIAHRDLKPENILYESESPASSIKISDFGLAAVCGEGQPLKELCGTPSYTAPEVLKEEGYGRGADIWSIGIIMYVLLSGALPFYHENTEKLLELVQNGRYSFPSPAWDKITPLGKDLVRHLLVRDPPQRFTVDQGLAHGWFAATLPSYHLADVQKSIKDCDAHCRPRRLWRAASLVVRMATPLSGSRKSLSVSSSGAKGTGEGGVTVEGDAPKVEKK